jgi:nucleoside 2-deoxyribosyltransferase
MVKKSLSAEDWRRLTAVSESASFEFRRNLPPDDVVAQTLSAFANTSGGALVIGASPDGELGFSRAEAERAQSNVSHISTTIMPGRLDQVTIRPIRGNHWVTVAEVSPPSRDDPPVITTTGQIFRRERDQNVRNDSALGEYVRKAVVSQGTIEHTGPIRMFVAMSFHTEQEPSLVDYYQAMVRAAARSKTKPQLEKMDLREGDFEISQEIINRIDACDGVLVDFTLSPANVYFEVGYARGQRKRIIQIARSGTVLELTSETGEHYPTRMRPSSKRFLYTRLTRCFA